MDENIGLEMSIEKERQKCLKGIQQYYQKYGCEQIKILRDYLLELCESCEETEKEEIKKQLALLDDYS
jgi:hypothetical protein